ncbi:TraR/DksA family transcriptional regulator [Mycetocola zhadangensis]|uniref:TraR/DksA family transcriptional regulator n=1 Tax=Mycetocola zhadangensis TaxID=1164595 RepID=A0A3L7J3Q3_9MICO|nr:TraR/DksA family transcriptional regulator [Mycetocola zhadangensis]RLQ84071.1 TraR/DksA family transcriptional regulator [Mycetocola zhadangensis]GGE96417.1 DnaK suppressor protein [Mycetocola zhadangensis]
MEQKPLASSTLRHFHGILDAQRAELVAQQAHVASSLAEVREARDGEQDDEHDPEGPTLTTEWSRLTGLQDDAVRQLKEIDKALGRIADRSYGFCSRCGQPIARARLEARPVAELCIECARLAETGR